MIRKTVVVQGQVAFAALRAAAARSGANGLQIMTVSQLAARLAGGFFRLAGSAEVEQAVARALETGGFEEIESVRHLPGMPRAIARTLRNAWNADLSLVQYADAPRIRDLMLVEARVLSLLPAAALSPHALCMAALGRMRHAKALFGEITLDGVHFVDPVWRPLLHQISTSVALDWIAPAGADTDWLKGRVTVRAGNPATPRLVSCADPRHEVLEAFRWARRLLASGLAKPGEIAIAAAATGEWDDHVMALAEETALRVCFPHGRPCLATAEGQTCAALADILLHGLSQARLRRLVSRVAGQGTALDSLTREWLEVPRDASLASAAEWERAFGRAVPSPATDPRPIVMPILDVLERGVTAAGPAADLLLRGAARRLWQRATTAAPAAALELTLGTIRVGDVADASDAIIWTPAWQLAAAPRPWVRLLGLTARGWPRSSGEDPLLPAHLISGAELDADPPGQADRRSFAIIKAFAQSELILSRSRRNAQGARIGPSPLLRRGDQPTVLRREGATEHACSESDRLAARPDETVTHPLAGAAVQCWRAWHIAEMTAHDGAFSSSHPLVLETIDRPQSPTSLTRMLRDPQGFVWRYALGWRAPQDRERRLTLAPNEFGSLVHELLRLAVDALEPIPGFIAARPQEISEALDLAVRHVTEAWPLERSLPPHVLWVNTVRQAAEMALAGLTWEQLSETGTRSWTEVPFGGEEQSEREWPWNISTAVTIPGTNVSVRGRIDRLDLRAAAEAVRVTDYKTGDIPMDAATRIIAGGADLQRVIYGLACTQLLPETPAIRARLVYLKGEPTPSTLRDLDGAITQLAQFVTNVISLLKSGNSLPGPAAEERVNDLRLALPASPGYFRRKQASLASQAGRLHFFWNLP
ncbi:MULTISPECIES: PD-(D/E)XK nuclease family protein [unclassified Mesorhizobium]|uniref:PD-(D/E)XK nuclease family protein n=1 Tax=unclassified Mesorhizobium TaxID=325217 RepID=UPI001674F8F9|nr:MULTISPECIES: PD-(D/E)XK nuclease family protein [unclassified Mesorhizobium]